jgi:hypothetical protein
MMKRILLLSLLATTALVIASTGAASATVLCKTATEPCSSVWPAGTTLQASLKSGSQFTLEAGFTTIACTETSMKGEVTNAGPGNVSGPITSISFGGCGSVTVDVLTSKGTFSIESGSGGNGAVTLTGVEVTFSYLGTSCVYGFGFGTSVGQLSGGSMASLTEEASVPKIAGGFTCANPAKWKAPLTVTSPEPLYVEAKAAESVVLCKVAAEPCTSPYGKKKTIEGTIVGSWLLKAGFAEIKCTGASINGSVTNLGTTGPVTGTVNSIGFSSCGSSTVDVLKNGTFSIGSPSGGNGTFKLEGFEVTVAVAGTSCVYGGTASFSLTGGTTASLKSTGSLAKVSGGATCASPASLTAEYKVNLPEPLYVEAKEGVSEPVVLCKSATSPCTGTYAKGTAIEASSTGSILLKGGFAEITCTANSIKGEVTNPGPTGPVAGTVSSLSFSSCGSSTVDVLKNGTFSIGSPSGGNGTFKLEGFEVTVAVAGTSCVYGGPATFSLTGGTTASLKSSGNLTKVSGGFLCASPASWSAAYNITAPAPLYVEAS